MKDTKMPVDGRERIIEYVEQYQNLHNESQPPIYEIVLFEHPCKELIYHRNGEDIPSGFPDANLNSMGFYYELYSAVSAMNGNWLDIQETVFHAGFILCRFPGLYQSAGPEARIYFLWNEERQGFFESEEPELFRHIAY